MEYGSAWLGAAIPASRLMANLLGSSEHGLDDKGRLILPGRILDSVAKADWEFVVTAGLDRCLLLHTKKGFQELVDRIGRAVPGSRAHRALCRRFLGHSEAVVPDGNRRIRIPDPLLKYAGLAPGHQVTLVGLGQVCEIWSTEQLGTSLAEAGADEESLFASLIEPTKPLASVGGP